MKSVISDERPERREWSEFDPDVLVALTERVRAQMAAIAASIVESYINAFEEYARLQPQDRELVVETAYLHLRSLLVELEEENPESSFDAISFARAGALRMRMGIPLDALLRSFNLWGRAVLDAFRSSADLDDPSNLHTLLFISERINWHVEQGMASMATGYLREANTTWSDRELTRFSFLEALVTGRLDSISMATSSDFEKQLDDNYQVIVASTLEKVSDITRRPQDFVRRITRVLDGIAPRGKWLVGSREGTLYVLWPGQEDRATAFAAATALKTEFSELGVGVGNHYEELANVRNSYDEAKEASTIANCLEVNAPLVYRDLRLERLAHRSPLLHELSRETLRPLLDYDRRKQAALVPTLQAFIAAGSNVAEAAKEIFVHPNTVVYRLKRVEEISGFDPRDSRGLLRLSLSLLVYKFLLADISPAAAETGETEDGALLAKQID